MIKCNCIERISKGISEKTYPGAEDVSISDFEFLSGSTYSNFEATVDGNEIKVPVLHRFCPWCGLKYDRPEE
jgi:hypothetical protein